MRNLDKIYELLKLLPNGWHDSSWQHDELDSLGLDNSNYKIWIASPEDDLGVAGSFNYSLQTDEEVIIYYCELEKFLEEFKLIKL